jgi:hypothetical protein
MNKTLNVKTMVKVLGFTTLLVITLSIGMLAGSVIGGVVSAQGPAGGPFGFGGMMAGGRGMMGAMAGTPRRKTSLARFPSAVSVA